MNPKHSLKGQVAFVSGASKGIGVAIADAFASAGADLALTARDEVGLDRTARACRERGVRVWAGTCELSNAAAVRALGARVLAEFKRVDVLVNNAGLTFPQLILDIGEDEWRTTIDVDLYAPLLLTQAFAPGMVQRRRGKIVNVSSRAGLGALEEHGAYSAAKAGLQLLTQTMAVEFGPHNIQANCVAPTVILTPMAEQVWKPGHRTDAKLSGIPAGRFGRPGDVADVVMWLASPMSDYVNGAVIPVDGGEGAR